MEHIIRERIYPQGASPIPRLRLSPLLLIVVVMLISFAVVNFGMRGMAQYLPSLPNPFADYADIFPGQPASAVQARGISCVNDYDRYVPVTLVQVCELESESSVFSEIKLVIIESRINEMTFVARRNALSVGDLASWFATPAVHFNTKTVFFTLPENLARVVVFGQAEHFSLFLPVSSITFMKFVAVT